MNLQLLYQQHLAFTLDAPVRAEAIVARREALSRPIIKDEAAFQTFQASMKLRFWQFALTTFVCCTAAVLMTSVWWLLPALPCGLMALSLALGLGRQHTVAQWLQALRHEAKGLRPVTLGELTEIARLAKTDPALAEYAAAVQQMAREFVAADLYLMKRFEKEALNLK